MSNLVRNRKNALINAGYVCTYENNGGSLADLVLFSSGASATFKRLNTTVEGELRESEISLGSTDMRVLRGDLEDRVEEYKKHLKTITEELDKSTEEIDRLRGENSRIFAHLIDQAIKIDKLKEKPQEPKDTNDRLQHQVDALLGIIEDLRKENTELCEALADAPATLDTGF